MAKLVWAPSALADLKNIATYISNDSPKAAKAQVVGLVNKAKVLAKFPDMGRPVPELKNMQIRQILEGRYRIIYQLIDKEVHILTVHHQSMLLKNNPVFAGKLK